MATPADIARMRGLMNPTAGDKQQAMAQALMRLSSGLLQGGAPQATPGGFARGLAQGMGGFTQAYSGAMDAARKRNLGGLQMQMALDAEARKKAAEERAVIKFDAEQKAAQKAIADRTYLENYIRNSGKYPPGTPGEVPGSAMALPHELGMMDLQAQYTLASKHPPAGVDRRTKIMKNAEALGLVPESDPYKAYIKTQSDKAGMTINLKGKGTGASAGVLESYNKAYEERLPQRRERLRGLTRMMELVPKIDSGAWGEQRLALSKAAKFLNLGVDPMKIANAEEFRSQSMARILELIQQTKGAISEKEMDAFGLASAGLKNTPEGNALLLRFAIEGERREERLDQLRVSLVQKNPKINKFELDAQVDQARRNMRGQTFLNPRETAQLMAMGMGQTAPAQPSVWRGMSDEDLLKKATGG